MEKTIYCLLEEYDCFGFGHYYFFKYEKDLKEKNYNNAFLDISTSELEDLFYNMDNFLKSMHLQDFKVIYSYTYEMQKDFD